MLRSRIQSGARSQVASSNITGIGSTDHNQFIPHIHIYAAQPLRKAVIIRLNSPAGNPGAEKHGTKLPHA